jgi:multiple sugar transport system ATP-binding protein
MSEVVLEKLCKNYGEVRAVIDADLTIADKEFVVLVGPSGCGKTTTLRMIAGLEEITAGTLYINGEKVNHLTPMERNVAMVFQSYALYPHMNVFDNMAFGLKMRKVPKGERKKMVMRAAEILGIEELLKRKPRQLSGGQRQRVALGRAIVRDPSVFLFDEPLSNLDAKLRVQMRHELKKLHERLQATVVYVTHDQVEAMTMGDRIVVMKDGLVQQIGSPLELYNQPANQFVAGFIGSPSMNFIPCQVSQKGGQVMLDTGDFTIPLKQELAAKVGQQAGGDFIFGIRPEHFMECKLNDLDNGGPKIKAEVSVIEPLGKEIFMDMSTGKHSIAALLDADCSVGLREGIELIPNMEKIHLFKADSGEAVF